MTFFKGLLGFFMLVLGAGWIFTAWREIGFAGTLGAKIAFTIGGALLMLVGARWWLRGTRP